MLAKRLFSYTVYITWLQSSTMELQWLEYLQSVFLEIPNVTTGRFSKIRSHIIWKYGEDTYIAT